MPSLRNVFATTAGDVSADGPHAVSVLLSRSFYRTRVFPPRSIELSHSIPGDTLLIANSGDWALAASNVGPIARDLVASARSGINARSCTWYTRPSYGLR